MTTAQEMFNRVVAHCNSQGEQAIEVYNSWDESTNTSCVYLSTEGHRCAIGALIPDGHPALHFGGGVQSLLEDEIARDLRRIILPTDLSDVDGDWQDEGDWQPSTAVQFANGLQELHDEVKNWTERKSVTVKSKNGEDENELGKGRLTAQAVRDFAYKWDLTVPSDYIEINE